MHWIIRDCKTGEIEHCPTVQGSEVMDRVALLNRGTPTRADNQSWGKLTTERARRPGKGVKDGAVTLQGGLTMPSPTECVERLVRGVRPEIADELWAYKTADRSLDRTTLKGLLAQVIEPRVWAAFKGHQRFERFVNAVSEQLRVNFGIRRANDRM
jgi:hypothetical protein